VTSVFKIRKNSRIFTNFKHGSHQFSIYGHNYANFTKFLKLVKIRLSHHCKVFEFAQQLAVDYTEAIVEWEQ